MAYQLFIFDFDGTLADSGPLMTKAFNSAALRFGFRQVQPDEIEALRSQDNRAIIKALRVPMWRMPQIAAYIRKFALESESPPLFPGIPEALRALHGAGATLAIVSSNSEAAIRRALGPDCADLIQIYGCSASLFGKAPKFKKVVKKARIAPRDAIAIGDEARDIEAARKAGVACGAVSWGYATPGLLKAHAPDVFLNTPADITALAR